MSNRLIAQAKVKEHKIIYTYKYEGIPYEIEQPITPFNDMVKDGEIVDILIAVVPHTEFKPEDVIEPKT